MFCCEFCEIFTLRNTSQRLLLLFKSLRIWVGILFDPTVLWLLREEIMLKISLQSVSDIKNESLFIDERKSTNCFLNI